MMMRLCGCLTCDMGSYKASLGCDVCSRRAVMGCHGNVPSLLRRYEKARQDVINYLRYGEVEPAEETTQDSFAA